MKTRLDAELVRRELARSREQAADLIEKRSVLVNGIPATKPATQVDAETSITISGDRDDFVSRGGHKLDGALNAFTGVTVEGKRCLDAGASTGGFTDVLLRKSYHEADLYKVNGRYGSWNMGSISVMAIGTFVGWGFVTNSFASWLSWQGYFLTYANKHVLKDQGD